MSKAAIGTVPSFVYPSLRRARPGFQEASWRYLYILQDSGDGTGGTHTLSVIPPGTVTARNRITIKAVTFTNDGALATVRFRVITGPAGAGIIYNARSATAQSANTGSFDVPVVDIPRDIVVPDGTTAFEIELATTNVNLQVDLLRVDLLVEAFEPS